MMHFQVGWLAGSCWLVVSNLCLIFHSTWCFWLRLCLEYFLIGWLKQIYNDWEWGMGQVAALPTLRLNIFSSLQINGQGGDYQELGRISPGKQNSNETLPIPKGCFNFGYV